MARGIKVAGLGSLRPVLKHFDGKDDFPDWQRLMKNVLIPHDLDDALPGDKPTTMTEMTWTNTLKKAKSSIEIHLTKSVRSYVIEKMTIKEEYDKLEKVYMDKTVSNKLFLKIEPFGLCLEEGGDIEDHVCRFQFCLANFQKVEETYKDDDIAIILFRPLPSSFKHFRTTLIFEKESLQLEDVIQALKSSTEKYLEMRCQILNIEMIFDGLCGNLIFCST